MTHRPAAASRTRAAVVVPIGPGKDTALDTLESVDAYCPEPHQVIIVDDHTSDGTYEALVAAKKSNWTVLRNERPLRLERLVHTLCVAFRHVLDSTTCELVLSSTWRNATQSDSTTCELVLRLDQDALLIKPGVLSEGLDFMAAHRKVGLFGVYEVDYNRPRNWEVHRRRITRETGWLRRISGRSAFYLPFLREAERRGYTRGDNVYGGAYWITRACLEEMRKMTALDPPYEWHSALVEDVYFSIATVAAGFEMGHFAFPSGPLCLEQGGLPYPAAQLAASRAKVVHSVDKGPNTDPASNGGITARQFFRRLRQSQRTE